MCSFNQVKILKKPYIIKIIDTEQNNITIEKCFAVNNYEIFCRFRNDKNQGEGVQIFVEPFKSNEKMAEICIQAQERYNKVILSNEIEKMIKEKCYV